MVAEESVDLILLDIMMPDMDGYEVCKALKDNPKTADIPVIFITAKTDEDSIERAYEVGGVDYITKPFRSREVLSRISNHLALREQKTWLENAVKEKTQELSAINIELEDTQREILFAMGYIGEIRSKETANHVKRVARYSQLLAKYYGLDEEEAQLIKDASPMHDIGKVGIPDAILNKPGKLTSQEYQAMKEHADFGYELFKNSKRKLLQAASIISYEHHEKYDGSGYPRGLKGTDIHIYGRITALADVFDALASDRVYKKAWADEKIFSLIREESGKHFDPKLVDIFFENLGEFLTIRDELKDVCKEEVFA
jgi:putative two-component system response regulator